MDTRTVQIAKNGLKNENVAATKLKIFIKNLENSKHNWQNKVALATSNFVNNFCLFPYKLQIESQIFVV